MPGTRWPRRCAARLARFRTVRRPQENVEPACFPGTSLSAAQSGLPLQKHCRLVVVGGAQNFAIAVPFGHLQRGAVFRIDDADGPGLPEHLVAPGDDPPDDFARM